MARGIEDKVDYMRDATLSPSSIAGLLRRVDAMLYAFYVFGREASRLWLN